MTLIRKLIEVALPLEAINTAAAKEKNPFTRNHPRAMHVWWARRPLAACRAVLFASLVDDPSSHPDNFPSEADQEIERKRLFDLVQELVLWENSANVDVLTRARAEIARSTHDSPPIVLDPFCGGGSIPLEAQRLGLEAHGSDLNPVAVTITKALIEIPPKFAGRPPVNNEARARLVTEGQWKEARGLAADVRYYGTWMREEAERRIGHLYPKAKLPNGDRGTVSAWIWARTVNCPNPACGAEMPLVHSFALSTKKGKEAWVEPVIDRENNRVDFEIRTEGIGPPEAPKVGRGGAFRCLVCRLVAEEAHLKAAGTAGKLGVRLMAMVVEGKGQRVYLAPTPNQAVEAERVVATWSPDQALPDNPRWFSPPAYGMKTFTDLFTSRQLVALTTFTDLVLEARNQVAQDAIGAGMEEDGIGIESGGTGATAYGDAVATYLGLSVSRIADFMNTICSWDSGNTNLRQLFARQAIPMSWDFAETNPFSGVVTLESGVGWTASALEGLVVGAKGEALQSDATVNTQTTPVMVCTDPPYYDNIGYADLSDFFYVWLRRALHEVFPDMFSTLLVPKLQELIATPYRFGGDKHKAEAFFEHGLGDAFSAMKAAHDPAFPLTLFYAYKQEDKREDGRASTGWETMLSGLLEHGFAITATWPMRTEQQQRSVAGGTNALASSIVLVCRARPDDAPLATRKEFVGALKAELPEALRLLQHGNVAPVDLAQASIGPGMAIYSRYAKVVESDGKAMAVRSAMTLINQILDEVLSEQEGDFEDATRFALAWFETYGLNEAAYGQAEVLAKAKNTSPEALQRDGFLIAKAGKVQLRHWKDLPDDWDPATDRHLTIWEATHHLIRAHQSPVGGSEAVAAALFHRLGGLAEPARELAYRLYRICEIKNWADLALFYNGLIVAWPEIARLAEAQGTEPEQLTTEGI